VLAIGVLADELRAQADSSVAPLSSPAVRVMQRLRTDGVPGEAGFVLRGFRGEWTLRQQNELADSLTAFILDANPAVSEDARLAAFETLFAATGTEGYGVPFKDAFIWLKVIAESDASGFVHSAVSTITYALPDRTLARRLLADIALHPGPAAVYAVQYLASHFGEPGVAELRRLHTASSAGTPTARRMIGYVVTHGAPRPFDPSTRPTEADTSAAAATSLALEVMRWVRINAVGGHALFALRSFDGAWTRRQQDEIADSLVAFLIDPHEDDRFESQQSARHVLLFAGGAEGYGTPYAGAGERLRRIAKSEDPTIAAGALFPLQHFADTADAVRIIEDLARDPRPIAANAVSALESSLGERGLEALRRLHAEGSAGTRRAREMLESIAQRRGWGDPTPSADI
jgi:hypothetical protein